MHVTKAVSSKIYMTKKGNKKPMALANGDTIKIKTKNNRKIATQDIILGLAKGR